MNKQIEAGIPETWFRPLLQSNSDIPQGFGEMTLKVAPHFFRSLLIGEVTSFQAIGSNLSSEQTREMVVEGNKLHQKFGVKREVKYHDIDWTWGRTVTWLSEGALALLRWKNEEVGTVPKQVLLNNVVDRKPPEGRNFHNLDLATQFCDEFDLLKNDPAHQPKLESFVRIADAVQRVFDFNTSKRAIDRHIDLGLNDPDYCICAGEALIPMEKRIANIAAREAALIDRQQGMKIPTDVVKWFEF